MQSGLDVPHVRRNTGADTTQRAPLEFFQHELLPLVETLVASSQDGSQSPNSVVPDLENLAQTLEENRAVLPTEFTGLEEMIRAELRFLQVWCREAPTLDDPKVSWHLHITSLLGELVAVRNIFLVSDPSSEFRACRLEGLVSTVSTQRSAESSLQIPVLNEFELNARIGVIGAEVSFCAAGLRYFQELTREEYFPHNRLYFGDDGLFIHIAPVYENFRGHLMGSIEWLRPYIARDGHDLDLCRIMRGLIRLDLALESLRSRQTTIPDFIERCLMIHEDLCADTIFRGLPGGARELRLSLREFNTESSGIPFDVFPVLHELDKGFLINPDAGCPQEGLARTRPEQEEEELARAPGTRTFVILSRGEPEGYLMFLPRPLDALLPGSDLIEQLQDNGFIPHGEDVVAGYVRSAVVKKKDRVTFARAGVNAYDLLDNVMRQNAWHAGCSHLIATVRVGTNANTSILAHQRVGWRRTGIKVSDTSEVIIRSLDTPTDSSLDSSSFGAGAEALDSLTADELQAGNVPPTDRLTQELVDGGLLCPEQARRLARGVIDRGLVEGIARGFSERFLHKHAEVKLETCDGRLIVLISAWRGTYRLEQVRPNFDSWKSDSSPTPGRLLEILEAIRALRGAEAG